MLTPAHSITFLGFVLDSIAMTVRPTSEKAANVRNSCHSLMAKEYPNIREVAEIVGKLVACFPGVQFASLFYRQLDNEKTKALEIEKGNYDATMSLSELAKSDLLWWCNNIESSSKPISPTPSDMIIQTDAPLSGWGAIVTVSKPGDAGMLMRHRTI